jgi:c-di-GMP-binding flagellar brake protein YcgR
MFHERRRYSRKIWNHDVIFQVTGEDAGEAQQTTFRGEATNISAGGLRINSETHLKPGLRISFGETTLSGVVKWSCACGAEYSAGIQLF